MSGWCHYYYYYLYQHLIWDLSLSGCCHIRTLLGTPFVQFELLAIPSDLMRLCEWFNMQCQHSTCTGKSWNYCGAVSLLLRITGSAYPSKWNWEFCPHLEVVHSLICILYRPVFMSHKPSRTGPATSLAKAFSSQSFLKDLRPNSGLMATLYWWFLWRTK